MESLAALKQNYQAQLQQTLVQLKELDEQAKALMVKKEQLRGAIYALESLQERQQEDSSETAAAGKKEETNG
jgi:hypothetical protein